LTGISYFRISSQNSLKHEEYNGQKNQGIEHNTRKCGAKLKLQMYKEISFNWYEEVIIKRIMMKNQCINNKYFVFDKVIRNDFVKER
jgi:hypothetical protein